jgi:hypothetical protein
LSIGVVGIVLLFAFGEGVHLSRFTERELAMFAFFPLGVCLGMIIAWRWEIIGGGLTVLSLAGFYFIDWLFSSSFPRGWWFLVIASPGVLFLLSGALAHKNGHSHLRQ